MDEYASGENYAITVDRWAVHCRVWRRSDLDSQRGLQLATEIREHLRELRAERGPRGLIMDQREGPPVAGPRTGKILSDIIRDWAENDWPVAILCAAGMQRLQIQRIVTECGAESARVVEGEDEANGWARAPSGHR